MPTEAISCVSVLLLGALLVVLVIILSRLADLRKEVRELAERFHRVALARETRQPPAPTAANQEAPLAPAAGPLSASAQPPPGVPAVSPTPPPQPAAPPSVTEWLEVFPAPPAPPPAAVDKGKIVERLFPADAAAATSAPLDKIEPAAKPPAAPLTPREKAFLESLPPVPHRPSVPREKLELFLGRKMLAWVGMGALLVGSIFLLIWLHEHTHLTDLAKVLINAATGVGLLAAGEWASRKKWTPLARSLSGGGLAELLFANFWALALCHNEPLIHWPGFVLFTGLVIALAIVLAIRYNSLTISIIATVSGVAVPLMLWKIEPRPDFAMVFAFLAAVDASVMILAGLKHWRVINLIAFLGTVLNVLCWLGREHGFNLYSPDHLSGVAPDMAATVIGGFYLLFLTVSLVYHLVRKEEGPLDLPVFILNPLWAYPTAYALFNTDYHNLMGPLAAGLGLLYLVLATLVRLKVDQARKLYSLALALGIGFVSLAIPIHFEGLVIPMTFALLAVLLYAAAEIAKEFRLRIAGFVVYLFTGIALFEHWSDLTAHAPNLIISQRFMTLAVCAAALAVTALLIRRSKLCSPFTCGPACAAIPALLAHALVLVTFTLEVRDACFARGLHFGARETQLVCLLGYFVYAVALLAAGFFWRQRYLKVAAFALVWTAMSWTFFDYEHMLALQAHTIINLRFAVLAVAILWLALAAQLIRRRPGDDNLFKSPRDPVVLAVLAHILVLALFTLETTTFLGQDSGLAASHLARQMTYSIGYALYAVGLLVAGFGWRQLYLRILGLVLLGLTLGKVLIYDMRELNDLYRIFSVLGVAVLLLAGALLYNKYQDLFAPPSEKSLPS